MQATRHVLPLALAPERPSRASRGPAALSASIEPALSALERWTERFCDRLVAWGDGATHRRLGSWTRR
jgi:hypothetical protein